MIEPFTGMRTHVVTSPTSKEKYTVAIAPANQWQGWGWLRELDERSAQGIGSDTTGIAAVVVLALALPALVPLTVRWAARVLGVRREWMVTVRVGEVSGSRILRTARFVQKAPDRASATRLARLLVDDLAHGGTPYADRAGAPRAQ